MHFHHIWLHIRSKHRTLPRTKYNKHLLFTSQNALVFTHLKCFRLRITIKLEKKRIIIRMSKSLVSLFPVPSLSFLPQPPPPSTEQRLGPLVYISVASIRVGAQISIEWISTHKPYITISIVTYNIYSCILYTTGNGIFVYFSSV